MNQKEIKEEPQPVPKTSHPNPWDEFGSAPLEFLLKNPKVTPVALFVLALAPFVITAFVLMMIFFLQ